MSMEFHRGRLLDHVHLHAADLAKSKHFYRTALEALGRADSFVDAGAYFFADELFVDGDSSAARTHVHK